MTNPTPAHNAPTVARQMLNKVPEVTAFFWVIKVLCTTSVKPPRTTTVLDVGPRSARRLHDRAAATSLAVKYRSPSTPLSRDLLAAWWPGQRRGHPRHRQPHRQVSGVSPWHSAPRCSRVLAAARCSGSGARVERTLSIHSIITTRRETFYWLAILCHLRPRHRRRRPADRETADSVPARR